ncbi:MAG: hypothetical protein IPP72_11670 [Chitinophagaceae bacterium]|nr:hypothetical protein [Chitinophagaceae bacterium]
METLTPGNSPKPLLVFSAFVLVDLLLLNEVLRLALLLKRTLSVLFKLEYEAPAFPEKLLCLFVPKGSSSRL